MSSRLPFGIRFAVLMFALLLSGFAGAQTPFDWSGFYFGGNVGGNWVDYSSHGFSDSFNTQPLPGPHTTLVASTPGFDSINAAFLAGGQAGYNLQFGRFVLGFEGDFDGTPSSSTTKSLFVPAFNGDSGFSAERRFESDWIASARIRAGFAYDRFLFYATGGGAFTDVNVRATESYPPTGLFVSSGSQKTLPGWTAGLGAEWAVRKGVSIGLEYRHSGFGRDTYGSGFVGPLLTTQSTSVADSNNQVTLRVNFLLNGFLGR
jgi:outer membrane immunogenic protein